MSAFLNELVKELRIVKGEGDYRRLHEIMRADNFIDLLCNEVKDKECKCAALFSTVEEGRHMLRCMNNDFWGFNSGSAADYKIHRESLRQDAAMMLDGMRLDGLIKARRDRS